DVFKDLSIILIFVDHPCGFKHEKLELLQLDIAVGNLHLHCLVITDAPCAGFSADRAAAHHVEQAFAISNGTHGMMNTSAAKPRLRDGKGAALFTEQMIGRHTHIGVTNIAFGPILLAIDTDITHNFNAGRINRYDEHAHTL